VLPLFQGMPHLVKGQMIADLIATLAASTSSRGSWTGERRLFRCRAGGVRAPADPLSDRKAVILPALHLAQKEFGHVSDEAIVYVAGLVGTSPAEIEGSPPSTRLQPEARGKYHVQICRNISCSLLGRST